MYTSQSVINARNNINNIPCSAPSVHVKQRDIADALGITLKTVQNVFTEGYHCSDELRTLVKEAANRMGYISTKDRNESYLEKRNFPDNDTETKRMLILREQGFTNKQISVKVGRHYVTVLKRIGYQPKEYTKMSYDLYSERVKAEKQKRRELVANGIVAEYNKTAEEYNDIYPKYNDAVLRYQKAKEEMESAKEQINALSSDAKTVKIKVFKMMKNMKKVSADATISPIELENLQAQ